jgi:hypothetical protein
MESRHCLRRLTVIGSAHDPSRTIGAWIAAPESSHSQTRASNSLRPTLHRRPTVWAHRAKPYKTYDIANAPRWAGTLGRVYAIRSLRGSAMCIKPEQFELACLACTLRTLLSTVPAARSRVPPLYSGWQAWRAGAPLQPLHSAPLSRSQTGPRSYFTFLSLSG